MTPNHTHDCKRCVLLGTVEINEMHKYDVYECTSTKYPGDGSAVVRYGEEGEYWSSDLRIVNDPVRYPLVGHEQKLWLAVKELNGE